MIINRERLIMKANIKDLIVSNPSGLLELQSPLTIPEYRENFGFKLKNVFTIYKSRKINHNDEEWFAFSGKTLNNLFEVCEESAGDLLVVYIIETIKNHKVNCNLVLSNDAYKEMLSDVSCHILQVHQMYSKFWQDHIALNTLN